MATRIWYQSMTPLAHLTHYRQAIEDCAARTCSPGIAVSVNGVSDALYQGRAPADVLRYAYGKLAGQLEVIDICRKAEADGFAAVVLGSFSEPFLTEIRSLLQIPVVSLAEASLLVARSLAAEPFAMITIAAPNAKRLRGLVHRHGFDHHVSAVLHLANPATETDLNAALAAPDAVAADFAAVASGAIEAGADVVIPAEGLLNLIVHRAGLKTIGHATILDSVATSLLYAELLINLRTRVGTTVGRRWGYATPPAALLADLAKHR